MNLSYAYKARVTKKLPAQVAALFRPLKPAAKRMEAELFELGRQRLNALAKEG